MEAVERFARFKLMGWWDQEVLQNAQILVVGAGALGNEILKNLALLGVGNVLIIDMDTVEDSNLSRSILFRSEDIGLRKCEVAARRMKQIYPGVNVHSIHGSVTCDVGLGIYRWADLVIAGLDNREARRAVNLGCWKTGTPWVDGATERLNGIVRVFVPPDGACYECTMSDVDWSILRSRRSCNYLTREDMLEGKVPTTPTCASIIAGIQCQEAVKLLHGLEVLEGRGFIFNGVTHDSYVVTYPRKDNCLAHDAYQPIRKLKGTAANTTLKELLDEVRRELRDTAVLEFNHEIITSLECIHCGKSEPIFSPEGKVSERDAICQGCDEVRIPHTTHTIIGEEDFLDRTLVAFGIPPFDIIVAKEGFNRLFIEFSDDASDVLGPLFTSND